MLDSPINRICPSLICVARSNTRRQPAGLMKGNNPSTTNINANAPSSKSPRPGAAAKAYFLGDVAAGVVALPRKAWKNSLPGSTTITSDLLRKLFR